MTAISINGVTKIVNNKKILDNISFEVEKGEIFGLLGPNGAGKSTLMKIIVGLKKATFGSVRINGFNTTEQFEMAMEEVGAVIEQSALYGDLSGYSNMKIFATMEGINEEQIEKIMSDVGLEKENKKLVKYYSLGMKQRLLIGIALLKNPKILILDEPTNGLDADGILELKERLKNIVQKYSATVVISSHLLKEMEGLCDRFAIINKGRLKLIIDSSDDKNKYHRYHIETDDNIKAGEILNISKQSEYKTGELRIECNKDEICKVVKALIENGVSIYEVCKKEGYIEEKYFEIINEDK